MPDDNNGIDLSKPLAANEKCVVYVVYRGTLTNKETNQSSLADPVCTRTKREHADAIAEELNRAQENVFYLKYVASNGFPRAFGDGDALMARSRDNDMLENWEKLAAPHRRPIYLVAELEVVEEDDKETLALTLDDDETKAKKDDE